MTVIIWDLFFLSKYYIAAFRLVKTVANNLKECEVAFQLEGLCHR